MEQKRSRVNFRLRACSLVSTCRHRNTRKGDGEKDGASKREPAREILSFEFPVFADERSDPIDLPIAMQVQWCISQYKMACADFVQGAFLKLSVNSDSSFELKLKKSRK